MDKDSLARVSSTLEHLPASGDWNRENAISAAAFFEGDLSKWDISKWDTPTADAPVDSFKKTLALWRQANPPAVLQDVDVSNVKDMTALFVPTPFDVDTTAWDLSQVKTQALPEPLPSPNDASDTPSSFTP